jgi:multicomponent Na+:H+ antiporter subunit C
MSQFSLFAVTSTLLFVIGLFGMIALPHLLRKILAFNVMGIGIFLFLVNTAGRGSTNGPDPVPLAMVLTGIVVAVSATAFALALLRRIHAESGRSDLDADPDDGTT